MSRAGQYRQRLLGGLASLLCLITWPASPQASPAASPYRVKAAFLLNFVKFVEWPPAEGPLTICLWEDDPFDQGLDQLVRQESVNARPIVVRRIRTWPQNCQALFIPASVRDPFRILNRVSPGVLTVGESGGFLSSGGMINFVIEDRRVRFDVNQKSVEQASLRISSRLLTVARSVIR